MIEAAVAALEAGEAVVLPTDTVYGLACRPDRESAVRRLSELKGRAAAQPIALVAASVEVILEHVPELAGRPEALARTLLPGPYTLVFPNPARRLPWLGGEREDTIGVRVPDARGPGRRVLARVGAVAATSANRHGEPDARTIEEVSPGLLEAVAAVVDGGELPGTPSTVVDLCDDEPRFLRVGAVSEKEALARIAAATRG